MSHFTSIRTAVSCPVPRPDLQQAFYIIHYASFLLYVMHVYKSRGLSKVSVKCSFCKIIWKYSRVRRMLNRQKKTKTWSENYGKPLPLHVIFLHFVLHRMIFSRRLNWSDTAEEKGSPEATGMERKSQYHDNISTRSTCDNARKLDIIQCWWISREATHKPGWRAIRKLTTSYCESPAMDQLRQIKRTGNR